MKKTITENQTLTTEGHIVSWDEVDWALKRVGDLDAKSSRFKAEMNEEINRIKGMLDQKLKNIAAQRSVMEAGLKEFCELHRDQIIGGLKSRKLRFGVVGYRNVSRFSWPKKNATLVARLKELGLKVYIRIKEEPDKEGIKAHYERLPLKELGIKRKVEEEFYIEISAEG